MAKLLPPCNSLTLPLKNARMRVAKAGKCEDEKTLIYSVKLGSFSLKKCNLEPHKFSSFYRFLFTFSIQSSAGSEQFSDLLQHS